MGVSSELEEEEAEEKFWWDGSRVWSFGSVGNSVQVGEEGLGSADKGVVRSVVMVLELSVSRERRVGRLGVDLE